VFVHSKRILEKQNWAQLTQAHVNLSGVLGG
jgi:hypothetical protein